MINERHMLESDIAAVEGILAKLPAGEIIERRGFESRLAELRAKLAALPESHEPQKVQLTFRGKPVDGSHGIQASFAAGATRAFSDTVTAVAASLENALASSGPFPKAEQNRLFITRTIKGSFGFEFEVPFGEPELFEQASTTGVAVEKVKALFGAVLNDDTEAVSDLVAEIHPRAVKKAKEFLDYLVQSEARCSLTVHNQPLHFRDLEQVRRVAQELSDDNIRETQVVKPGTLLGVLPESRRFEFRDEADQTVLRGSISPVLGDASALIQGWVGRPGSATFQLTQVGTSRPRFRLVRLDHVSEA